MPWLLEIAFVLSIVTGRRSDGVAIAFLLLFNATIATLQERRADTAIDLLRSKIAVRAHVLRDGSWRTLSAEELVPDDRIHLGGGDIVPADALVSHGSIDVDQAILTGESMPRTIAVGETAFTGSTVVRGSAEATVHATGAATRYGSLAELVRVTRAPGQLERFVLRLVRALVAFSVVAIAAVAVAAAGYGYSFPEIAVFAMMIFLASVPIALPAAFALATALGATALAEKGAIVRRLSALEDAASMDELCVDKTGTITENRIAVQELVPCLPETETSLLAYACAASDASTQDPIDLAVLSLASSRGIAQFPRNVFSAFDPACKYSSAEIVADGDTVTVRKGSPDALRSVGATLPAGYDATVERMAREGARVLAVAIERPAQSRIVGFLSFADTPRSDAKTLIERLRAMRVHLTLLTGDTRASAIPIALAVGIADADVRASVFPDEKLRVIKQLERHHVVGMTGDGVNDAPALKAASIGIAVANATDVAKAAAGIVLTDPGLSNIVTAIESSRAVFERMLTYTLMKLVKYFEVVGFLTAGFFVTRAFLLTPELMVALLVFNDLVTLSISTDNVTSGGAIRTWHVARLIRLAALPAVGSLCAVGIAVAFAEHHWRLDIPHLQSAAFLAIVVTGQAMVYVMRTRPRATLMRPSSALVASSLAAVVGATVMVSTGMLTPALPLSLVSDIIAIVAAAALLFFSLARIGRIVVA